MMNQRNMMSLLLSLLLASCANFAPEYQRPAAPVPESYGQSSAVAADYANTDRAMFFTEDALKQVINLAIAHNRDLKVTALTIEKARAQYQVQRASLFPTINAIGSETAQGSLGSSSTTVNTTSHIYRATVGFSAYELDMFGRIRNLNTQALETFYATEQAKNSTHVSLVAEVGNAWLSLVADKMRYKLAQDTLENQQQAYEVYQKMFALGATSALTLKQMQTSVESAKVDVATYATLIQQDLNALNLLVGTTVPEQWLTINHLSAISSVNTLPEGVASSLLIQRPDIQQIEHQLKAANANIGAARAAFFPTISLSSTLGSASTELTGLFKAGTGLWTFVPQISLPIFNAGRNQANLEVAEVDQQILVATYEKTIQTAFREVADVLAQRTFLGEQLQAQQSLVNAAGDAFHLSELRFKNGIDSYLVVLDAQRTYYAAQQNLINLKLSDQTSQLTLYKVLGGGLN